MSDQLYIHKGEPFVLREINSKLSGFVPMQFIKLDVDPIIRMNIGKFPLPLWRTVMAFFKKVNDIEKAEAQVRLFYSDSARSWRVHAFPQEANTGMTTKELATHVGFQDEMNEMVADDYYQWGTIHSHCNTTAFQSSVDKGDEESSPGIHITMGKVSSSEIDVHTRLTVIIPGSISFEGEKETVTPAKTMQQNFHMLDFLELPPEWIGEGAPLKVRAFALDHIMKMPSDEFVDAGMLERWMKNRIPKSAYHYNPPARPGIPQYGHTHHYQREAGVGNPGNRSAYLFEGPVAGDKRSKKKRQKGSKDASSEVLKEVDRSAILPLVGRICASHGLTQQELCDLIILADSQKSPEQIGIMVDVDATIFKKFDVGPYSLIHLLQEWMAGPKSVPAASISPSELVERHPYTGNMD